MTERTAKVVGVSLVALMLGGFAVELWGDLTRDARFQKDRDAKVLEHANWVADHPAEASANAAKWKREEARLYRLFDATAACQQLATPEASDRCMKGARRREALECLNGPDWEECDAVNR